MITEYNLTDMHIIEPVSYEENKQKLIDLIQAIDPDIVLYKSSDEMVLLEAFAQEMTYADVRFNARMKAALPSYAKGEDLDTASLNFYGTKRLDGEDDARFFERSLESLQQSVTTGSDDSYIYHTKTVDPRITHVFPYRSGEGETTIVWHSTIEEDEDELALLQSAIEAKLFDTKLRTLCATRQSVVRAEVVYFDIALSLYIDSVFHQHTLTTDVERLLREYFDGYPIAKEVNLSKITSIAHLPGVEKVVVTAPTSDVIIGKEQIGVCRNISVSIEEIQDV